MPFALQHLDRHLGAHQRAAEVHQHEHAVVGHRALDRGADTLDVGPDRAILETAGGLEAQLLPAHLPRELDDAVGQRGAVRDDDDPDHVREPSAYAWCISSIGCTDGRLRRVLDLPAAGLAVADHDAARPDASTWPNRSAPASIAIWYFSLFSP